MEWSEENWKIIAGVAFFMLAIRSMEGSVAELSGRKFKLFLKRETSNRLRAAAAGTVIAAILQSSSVVNLIILDMTGSGILSLQSALALTLGANIGTTVNSWLVAMLGFNTGFESWVLPITGISGILLHFTQRKPGLQNIFRLLFSLSLLLFSLDFIKSGMGTLVTHSSLQFFKNPFLFALFGLAATAFVQASSIIMVLALTALYLHTVSFESACALVLGGEIGTTLKLFFAARGNTGVKKAMALGNFLFNVVTASVFLLFLEQACRIVMHVAGADHPVIALVLFQTAFNLVSLALFLPWLPKIAAFLSKRPSVVAETINPAINLQGPQAVQQIEEEVRKFTTLSALYIMGSFGSQAKHGNEKQLSGFTQKTGMQQYALLKQFYGQIHRLSLQVRKQKKDELVAAKLDQLVSAARNAMYAAKSIYNIHEDIRQFRNSSNDIKFNFYLDASKRVPAFCTPLLALINAPSNRNKYKEQLGNMYQSMRTAYRATLVSLYVDPVSDGVSDIEISSLLNCNREIFSAFKSLFFGAVELLLDAPDADLFQKSPGFIR